MTSFLVIVFAVGTLSCKYSQKELNCERKNAEIDVIINGEICSWKMKTIPKHDNEISFIKHTYFSNTEKLFYIIKTPKSEKMLERVRVDIDESFKENNNYIKFKQEDINKVFSYAVYGKLFNKLPFYFINYFCYEDRNGYFIMLNDWFVSVRFPERKSLESFNESRVKYLKMINIISNEL